MGNVSGIYKVWENEWFTVEQIDSDTFAVSEYKHLSLIHIYLPGTEPGIGSQCGRKYIAWQASKEQIRPCGLGNC